MLLLLRLGSRGQHVHTEPLVRPAPAAVPHQPHGDLRPHTRHMPRTARDALKLPKSRTLWQRIRQRLHALGADAVAVQARQARTPPTRPNPSPRLPPVSPAAYGGHTRTRPGLPRTRALEGQHTLAARPPERARLLRRYCSCQGCVTTTARSSTRRVLSPHPNHVVSSAVHFTDEP